jgi:hypothetical protein
MKINKSTGMMLAIAAAALFAGNLSADATGSAPSTAAPSVKCAGINSCKGKSACDTPSNKCAGLNSCKGKGWIFVKNEKDCAAQKGKVIK